jgi:hypothetical protein
MTETYYDRLAKEEALKWRDSFGDQLDSFLGLQQENEGYFGSTGAAIADLFSNLDPFGESPQRGPFGLEAYMDSSGMGFKPFTGNMLEGQYYAPMPNPNTPYTVMPGRRLNGVDPQAMLQSALPPEFTPERTRTDLGSGSANQGPVSQSPVSQMPQNPEEIMAMLAGMEEGFAYDIKQADESDTGQPQQELPTFGVDYSGVRRIEEMYAAGYLSLAEAEELTRQEIQNIYAELYSQYDSGAEEFATRQLATEQMLEGKRQTLADDLASYGYDSSGFDAEMQGIDEIRGMDQAASGNLLDRLSEIARTGEAGALSGLSESAMMAKSGMEMQEMAAIQAEEQRARASAAAQQAAFLEQQMDIQNWNNVGPLLGLPPQIARSLDATGMLDPYLEMVQDEARRAASDADAAEAEAKEADRLRLGASLLLDDPDLGQVYDLISSDPLLAESLGFGVSPQPLQWENMAYENPELAAVAFPQAQQLSAESFGEISWNDAFLWSMLMAMFGQTPEGAALLAGE